VVERFFQLRCGGVAYFGGYICFSGGNGGADVSVAAVTEVFAAAAAMAERFASATEVKRDFPPRLRQWRSIIVNKLAGTTSPRLLRCNK
jgi:uncharacterized membrane protein